MFDWLSSFTRVDDEFFFGASGESDIEVIDGRTDGHGMVSSSVEVS